jgi:glycosyltransferase involved in cell wall biosynthesis
VQVPLTRIQALPPEDSYVFLGSNWSYDVVLDLGKRHLQCGGDVVQMIYDLVPYKTPQFSTDEVINTFNGFLSITPTYASRFMCISDCTKRDFEEFLSSKSIHKDVHTVPLAHEFDGFARNASGVVPSNLIKAKISGQPYALCVGTVEIRKNGIALLHIWEQLLRKYGATKVPKLIFAGKIGWKVAEFMRKLESVDAFKHHVLIMNSPSDEDLAFLYQNCEFNLYPSHYEGWGLPIGEAAWLGKYTIASDSSSMPEVCGDLIDHASPDDLPAMAALIERAILDKDYVRGKEQQIRRATLRSWDDVADNVFSYVSSLALS